MLVHSRSRQESAIDAGHSGEGRRCSEVHMPGLEGARRLRGRCRMQMTDVDMVNHAADMSAPRTLRAAARASARPDTVTLETTSGPSITLAPHTHRPLVSPPSGVNQMYTHKRRCTRINAHTHPVLDPRPRPFNHARLPGPQHAGLSNSIDSAGGVPCCVTGPRGEANLPVPHVLSRIGPRALPRKSSPTHPTDTHV